MSKRFSELQSYIKEELIAHLPYTFMGVAGGVLFVFCVRSMIPAAIFIQEEFHWTHFFHLMFSAAASAAIFRSYHDSPLKAVPIAYLSSILLCSLSDVLIPALGLSVFQYEAHYHICTLDHPIIVSAFTMAGIALGLIGIHFFSHCNRGFHFMHLLISTAASTLFLLVHINTFDLRAAFAVGVSLFFALAIPCLVSDMALPLCFVRIKDEFLHEKVHHGHKSQDQL